MNLLLDDILW